MRSIFIEVSGGHVVKADGVTPWLPERYRIWEVAPGFWTGSLTWITWPG